MIKTKKIAVVLLPLALTLGAVGYIYLMNDNDVQKRNSENTNTQQNDASNVSGDEESAKSSATENEDLSNSEALDKAPVQYTAPDENEAQQNTDTLKGIIRSKSVQNDTLVIRTNINELIGNGSCKLTLSRSSDGKEFTQSVGIINNPSSSSCKGFDVPTSKLGSGKWNILITIKSDDKLGKIRDQVSL